MLLILNEDDIQNENIIFGEKTINNIIDNSYFYQIYFTNEILYLNSITVKFKLYNVEITNHFNKHKLDFKLNDVNNINSINNLIKTEYNILNIFQKNNILTNKFANYKIQGLFSKNYIKGFFKKNVIKNYVIPEITIIIKISGIWENNTHFGLNYKFLD